MACREGRSPRLTNSETAEGPKLPKLRECDTTELRNCRNAETAKLRRAGLPKARVVR